MDTSILVAPWMTWLLVSTSPEDEMSMPVPAPCPVWPREPWISVLMSTTAGSRRSADRRGGSLVSGEAPAQAGPGAQQQQPGQDGGDDAALPPRGWGRSSWGVRLRPRRGRGGRARSGARRRAGCPSHHYPVRASEAS